MQAMILEAAKARGIPVQRQVRVSGRGTNAWPMRMTRAGAAVALISVPLRYMHSPIEVLSLNDVEQCIELLAATLLSMPADISFAREQP